jgi:glycosyltransferase involved in cell wall biosynthesis
MGATMQISISSSETSARTRPKVSVCMPASRNSPWFQQALRSVLAQSLQDIEIVITDDSGGDLNEVAKSFSDSRIRYYANDTRLGFAANHCRAIELTTGDYVAFLHDDDEWEADYLASASEVLEKNPEVGLVLSGAQEVDGRDNVIGLRPARMNPGLQPDPLGRFLRPDFMMMLPSVALFRRAALGNNKRPWPDVVAADVTMFIDAVRGNWKVYYVACPLVRYRIHDHQIASDDLAHRHAMVTVWSSYKFSEDHFELQRKKTLAQSLIARAGGRLRRGNFQCARQDLIEARRNSFERVGVRWWVLRAATMAHFLLPPLLKLRECLPRKHRHAGI